MAFKDRVFNIVGKITDKTKAGAKSITDNLKGVEEQAGQANETLNDLGVGGVFDEQIQDLQEFRTETQKSITSVEQFGKNIDKLKGTLGSLKSSIKGISLGSIVTTGLGALIPQAIENIKNLAIAVKDYGVAQFNSFQVSRDAAENLDFLAEKARAVRTELEGFSDTPILSDDDLRRAEKTQLDSYEKQLQSARDYYAALKIEAKAATDEAGVADATARLEEYEQALADVAERNEALNSRIARRAEISANNLAKFEEAFKTLGTTIEEVNKAGSKDLEIVKAFEEVAVNVNSTAIAIDQGLDAALKKIKTPEGLRELSRLVQKLPDDLADVSGATDALNRANLKILQAQLKDIGANVAAIPDLLTEGAEKAIQLFDDIAGSAQATGPIIVQALAGALRSADTQEALDELTARIEHLGRTGQLSAAEVTQALGQIEDRSEQLTRKISGIDDAFKKLGVNSSEAILDGVEQISRAFEQVRRDGDNTAKDVERSFISFTEKAIANFDKLTQEQRESVVELIKSQAEGTKLGQTFSSAALSIAAATGNTQQLTAEIQKAKDAAAGLSTIGGIKAAFDGSLDSVKKVTEELAKAREASEKTEKAAGGAATGQRAAADEAERNAEAQTRVAEETQKAEQAAADLAATQGFVNQVVGVLEQRLAGLSERAKEAFQNSLTGGAIDAADAIDTTNEKLQVANDRVIESIRLQNSASNGVFTQIAGYYQNLSDQIEVATLQQKASVEQLVNGLESGSQAALAQLQSIGTDIDSLRNRFDLLDDQDLNNLINSLQNVQNEIDRSADKVASLEQRLAQLRGDEIAVQELRNKQAVLELEKELAAARERGNAKEIKNLEDALRLQKQINEEELKRAKQQEDDRRNRNPDTSRRDDSGGSASTPRRDQLPGTNNVIPLNIEPEQIRQPLQEVSEDLGEKLNRFVDVLDQRDRTERQQRQQERQETRSRSAGLGGSPIVVPMRDTDIQKAAFSGSFFTRFVAPAAKRQERLSQ